MCTATPSDDTSMRTGTPDLGELYATHAARVRRAVRGEVRASPPLIDDACQSAWTRLASAADRVHRDTAVAWLVTTAIHEAWRSQRRLERDASLEALLEAWGDMAEEPWGEIGPRVDELVGLRLRLDALRSLPERQRRLVWLQGLGLSYAEMAEATGASERTVQRQLSRGRRRLRETDGVAA